MEPARICLNGRFFSLVFESPGENSLLQGFPPRYSIRRRENGEFIPLEREYIDDFYIDTFGDWIPADIEDVMALAKITNSQLQDKLETAEANLSLYALSAKAAASKHNTWIWIIALCMIPFSWGISLLLLFFLRTTKTNRECINEAIVKVQRDIEWLEKKRDAAREYIKFLSEKERLEKNL